MEFNFDTALTRADALQGLLDRWKPAHDAPDALPLENAYGRTAAIDYRASYNLPVHRVSAFDGIAVSFGTQRVDAQDRLLCSHALGFCVRNVKSICMASEAGIRAQGQSRGRDTYN